MSSDTGSILDGFEEFMKDFRDNVRTQGEFQFPIEVDSIKMNHGAIHETKEVGSWVSIRPCDGDKTYLGVYLGNMTLTSNYSYHIKKKEISIIPQMNPAIYVPDLKRIVWGMESWWGVISNPEGLRKITDQDISNVWYVKALKDLQEESDGVPDLPKV